MEEQSRTYILEASDLSVSFETDAGEVQAGEVLLMQMTILTKYSVQIKALTTVLIPTHW